MPCFSQKGSILFVLANFLWADFISKSVTSQRLPKISRRPFLPLLMHFPFGDCPTPLPMYLFPSWSSNSTLTLFMKLLSIPVLGHRFYPSGQLPCTCWGGPALSALRSESLVPSLVKGKWWSCRLRLSACLRAWTWTRNHSGRAYLLLWAFFFFFFKFLFCSGV